MKRVMSLMNAALVVLALSTAALAEDATVSGVVAVADGKCTIIAADAADAVYAIACEKVAGLEGKDVDATGAVSEAEGVKTIDATAVVVK